MSTVTATTPATCHAECGLPIEPGDRVVYVNDELVHLECEAKALADLVNVRREGAR